VNGGKSAMNRAGTPAGCVNIGRMLQLS